MKPIEEFTDSATCVSVTLQGLPTVQINEGIAGFFKIEAIRPNGERRTVVDWQPNLITNSGMDYLGTGRKSAGDIPTEWIGYCRLGVGNYPVDVTDKKLANHIAEAPHIGTYNTGVQVDTAPFYHWQHLSYEFATGVAAGILREVGVGLKISDGDLSTRAILLDGQGDPAENTVLSDEAIEVTYEIRSYILDITPIVSQMDIDGTLYDTILLPCQIDDTPTATFQYGGGVYALTTYDFATLPNIGDELGEPTSAMDFIAANYGVPYVAGTYYQDTITSIPYTLSIGAKGVTAIKMHGNFQLWQMSFTQNIDDTWGIPHTANDTLYIRCRHTWARYTP